MSSPLLEDINLAGANGILVNVTAGMDLAIGEFQEVGNTVKEFASDDATVVVGTVIDPDMGDKNQSDGCGDRASVRNAAQANAPMRVVKKRTDSTRRNRTMERSNKPTVQRKRAVGDGLEEGGLQEELLDIPAFLRRQAD